MELDFLSMLTPAFEYVQPSAMISVDIMRSPYNILGRNTPRTGVMYLSEEPLVSSVSDLHDRWVAERRREYYYRLAKKLDYRSRASFKLIQIDERFGIHMIQTVRGVGYVIKDE